MLLMLRGKKGKKYCNYRIDGEHCRYNRRFFRFFMRGKRADQLCSQYKYVHIQHLLSTNG